MTSELAAADFTPLIGTALVATANVDGAPVEVPLTLSAVEELTAPAPQFRAPLVLSLTGPPTPVLTQGIYALEHPVLGPLELFVVTHAVTADAASYSITLG